MAWVPVFRLSTCERARRSGIDSLCASSAFAVRASCFSARDPRRLSQRPGSDAPSCAVCIISSTAPGAGNWPACHCEEECAWGGESGGTPSLPWTQTSGFLLSLFLAPVQTPNHYYPPPNCPTAPSSYRRLCLVEIPEPWDLQQPLPPAAGAPRQSVGWTPFGSASGGPERTGASASVSWLVSDGCSGTRHLSTGPEGTIGLLRLSRARLLATDVLPYSLVRASVRLLPASVHRPPED